MPERQVLKRFQSHTFHSGITTPVNLNLFHLRIWAGQKSHALLIKISEEKGLGQICQKVVNNFKVQTWTEKIKDHPFIYLVEQKKKLKNKTKRILNMFRHFLSADPYGKSAIVSTDSARIFSFGFGEKAQVREE